MTTVYIWLWFAYSSYKIHFLSLHPSLFFSVVIVFFKDCNTDLPGDFTEYPSPKKKVDPFLLRRCCGLFYIFLGYWIQEWESRDSRKYSCKCCKKRVSTTREQIVKIGYSGFVKRITTHYKFKCIILIEILLSHAPFYCTSRHLTRLNVLNWYALNMLNDVI